MQKNSKTITKPAGKEIPKSQNPEISNGPRLPSFSNFQISTLAHFVLPRQLIYLCATIENNSAI
jgi:hypothetical protein